MSIQQEITRAVRDAGLSIYQQFAPEGAQAPLTVFRQLDGRPESTLGGGIAMRQSSFVFFNIGIDPLSAVAQRDAVRAAILASDTLKDRCAFEISSGEAEYEEKTNEPIEPCAFSFWHE